LFVGLLPGWYPPNCLGRTPNVTCARAPPWPGGSVAPTSGWAARRSSGRVKGPALRHYPARYQEAIALAERQGW